MGTEARVSSSSTSSSSSSSSSASEDSCSSDHSRRHKRRDRRSRRVGKRSSQHRHSNKERLEKRSMHQQSNFEKKQLGKRKRKHYTERHTKSDQQKAKKDRRKVKAVKVVEGAENCSSFDLKNEDCHNTLDSSMDLHRPNGSLKVMVDAQEHQKAMIRRNAEIAKARLASGELQRAKEQQNKFYQMYGTVDWRARKKLRTEKKALERTVAAGKKLASLEQREHARMDAFRVALGLPTAEAQRQAEWRAEATQALMRLEACSEAPDSIKERGRSSKHGIIGPMLPP